jgi:hypothetical protein
MQLADGLEKATAIHKLQKKWGYRIFVETGTADATTFESVCLLNSTAPFKFTHMFSIENDHSRYLNCIERMVGLQRNTVIFADSAVHLPRMIQRIEGPVLYFLDAHGAQPEEPTPIREELAHIFYHAELWPVVLIDDARLFNAWSTWPNLSEIEEIAISHHYECTVENDMIRLEPRV